MSVQIRTYHEVCAAAIESKRFAQEAQALLSLDHQIIQRQYAMMCGQQVTCQEEMVTKLSAGNVVGLLTDDVPASANGRPYVGEEGHDDGSNEYLAPPPVHGLPMQPSPTMAGQLSTMALDELTAGFGPGSGRNTPTSSTLSSGNSSGNPSNVTDSTLSAPLTPTPTKATFVVEATNKKSESLMQALKEVHKAQDSVDAAADEAALRGTLVGALDAHNDVEMVRCLQVARAEIPEAAETLRRMLGIENGNERVALERGEHSMEGGNTELDRKFMQSGIEAMMRLTTFVAKEPCDEREKGGLGEGASTVDASKLPSWTITRYVSVIILRPRLIHACACGGQI